MECLKCKGTGEILLFSSRSPCDCRSLSGPSFRWIGPLTRVLVGRCLKRGLIANRGCVDIFLTDTNGVPVDPVEIRYEIFYMARCGRLPIQAEKWRVGTPVNPSVGEYYARLCVPELTWTGSYQIQWTYREHADSPECTVLQEFEVQG